MSFIAIQIARSHFILNANSTYLFHLILLILCYERRCIGREVRWLHSMRIPVDIDIGGKIAVVHAAWQNLIHLIAATSARYRTMWKIIWRHSHGLGLMLIDLRLNIVRGNVIRIGQMTLMLLCWWDMARCLIRSRMMMMMLMTNMQIALIWWLHLPAASRMRRHFWYFLLLLSC